MKERIMSFRIPELVWQRINILSKQKEITKTQLMYEALLKHIGIKYIPEQFILQKPNQARRK